MPFVELKPGKAGADTITISTDKRTGALIVGLTAAVVARNKLLEGEGRVRALVDLDGKPRMLQLIADPKGPFKLRRTAGDGAVLRLTPLSGFAHVRFKSIVVEYDEDANGEGKALLSIELPALLQPPPPGPAPQLVPAPTRPAAQNHAISAAASIGNGQKRRY